MMAKFAFIIVLVCYAAVGLLLHSKINEVVPDPYMDEIFHVPQCETFCRGNYSYWDPKITTLPGAYFSTIPVLRLLELCVPFPFDMCSVYWMRLVCVVFSVLNLELIYEIIGLRWKGIATVNQVLAALSISTFPVLYFFNFLYYTDVFSIFFLLLCYKFHLESMSAENVNKTLPRAIILSHIAGAISVFVRQTNIVWINYICIDQAFAYLFQNTCPEITDVMERIENEKPLHELRYDKKLRKRGVTRDSENDKRIRTCDWGQRYPKWADWFIKIKKNINYDVMDEGYFTVYMVFGFTRFVGYLLINVTFATFVFFNEGIAVGDRTAHQVSFNLPQIFYFFLFTGFMALPVTMISALKLLSSFSWHRNTLLHFLILGIMCLVIINFNTVAHPYLLADNRHYTFYVWKRLFEWFAWVKYALIPVYIFLFLLVIEIFNVKFPGNLYGQGIFLMFCALNLIPQLLLEFRYFIPGYLIFRLNIAENRKRFLILELLWYSLLNGATIYLFLYKPFLWPSSTEFQRFMW